MLTNEQIKELKRINLYNDYRKEIDNITNLENKHCDNLVLKLIDDISDLLGFNVRDYEVNVCYKGIVSNYILQEEKTEYKLIHPYGVSLVGFGNMEYFSKKEVYDIVIKHNKLMEKAMNESINARFIIQNKYLKFIN